MKKKVFSGIEDLPHGQAEGELTPGCIVLEGGAFRGLYCQGATDALMEAGVNMQCTLGVSAGALDGMNYVSGQIGRSARINLRYRHDPSYVGARALYKNQGIIGFDYLFGEISREDPLDEERFLSDERRFVVVATDYVSGKTKFFDKDRCDDIYGAVRASASMPYISRPVKVGARYYLDGGCSDAVPYQWAIDEGYGKIIVVRTRPKDFRKTVSEKSSARAKKYYSKTPKFADALAASAERYNRQCEEMERLEAEGRIFVLGPSQQVSVSRIEKDMEKLGDLYYLGYHDTYARMEELKAYLRA